MSFEDILRAHRQRLDALEAALSGSGAPSAPPVIDTNPFDQPLPAPAPATARVTVAPIVLYPATVSQQGEGSRLLGDLAEVRAWLTALYGLTFTIAPLRTVFGLFGPTAYATLFSTSHPAFDDLRRFGLQIDPCPNPTIVLLAGVDGTDRDGVAFNRMFSDYHNLAIVQDYAPPSLLAHELGHLFAELSHTDVEGDVMNRALSVADLNALRFNAADEAKVRAALG